jgi:hypothetical protein
MEPLILGHFLGPDDFDVSEFFSKDFLRWCVHVGIFVALVVAWLLSSRSGKMEGAM